jgi:hypothetical protein
MIDPGAVPSSVAAVAAASVPAPTSSTLASSTPTTACTVSASTPLSTYVAAFSVCGALLRGDVRDARQGGERRPGSSRGAHS